MFIFCIISGSALAQIAREFFNSDQNIPSIFKTALIQHFSNILFIWLAFFSNAGVNYYSMQRLFSQNNVR